MDYGTIESLNGEPHDDRLSHRWFRSLDDARKILDAFRRNDDEVRPRSSLENRTPNEVAERLLAWAGGRSNRSASSLSKGGQALWEEVSLVSGMDSLYACNDLDYVRLSRIQFLIRDPRRIETPVGLLRHRAGGTLGASYEDCIVPLLHPELGVPPS